MNVFTRIWLCISLLSCTTARTLSFDPEKESLKKGVQVVAEHEYDAEKPSSKSHFTIRHSIIQYTKSGLKTDENRFDADTNITAMWVFAYNKKKFLTEEKWLNPDSSIAYRVEYWYNRNNQLVRENHYTTGNLLDKTYFYSYHDARTLSEKLVFDRDSNLIGKTKYYYVTGRVNEVSFTDDNSVEDIQTYSHDKNGNLVSVCEFNEEGEYLEKTSIGYDKMGNIKELMIGFMADSSLERHQFKYEYDRNGNWTLKLDLKNDMPSKIIVREYGYY